jgi:hypothetical protein
MAVTVVAVVVVSRQQRVDAAEELQTGEHKEEAAAGRGAPLDDSQVLEGLPRLVVHQR